MAGTTQITAGEISPGVLIGGSQIFIDGKGTFTIHKISEHPKFRLIRGFVMLTEVPDAAGTTLTMQLFNAGVACTDIVTFTQGVETKGTTKVFTIVTDYEVVPYSAALTIVVAGTTTTAGQCIIFPSWQNVN